MIPKILHLTAKQITFSENEELICKHNSQILHNWDIIRHDDQENLKIVEKFFPEYKSKYQQIQKGVVKADIARCMYMYAYGGIYADTDYLFIKPLNEKILSHKCIIPAEEIKNGLPYLGNCIFISEKGYAFWKDYIDYIFTNIDPLNIEEKDIINLTGPGGITKFYLPNKEKYPDIYVPQKNMFHPLISLYGLRVITDSTTIGIHFCFGSWRSNNRFKYYLFNLIQKLQAHRLILTK